jgi:Domain of unknown function (DUF4149)
MTSIIRFLQVFALGAWLGAIIFLSFVVAPGAFSTLQSRDQAGAFVGMSLGRLHHIGVIAAIIYVIAALALAPSLKSLAQPATILVILMAALTAVSQHRVTPRMAALRHQIVSVGATPRDNPLRVEFDRLHVWSVRLEGAVLLLGLAALFLTVRSKP